MRHVLKVSAETQQEHPVCSGLGEDAALRMASDVRDQQVGAWFRREAGLPHEPLAQAVLATGLDSVPGGVCEWHPLDIARKRWAALPAGVWREIEAHRYAYVAGHTIRLRRSCPWTLAARLGVRVYPARGTSCPWPRA
jgi:hypothetical protein